MRKGNSKIERLAVQWSVDERTRVLKLPTMAFQPLVENALKYAVNTRRRAAHCGGAFERPIEAGR